LYSTYQVNSKKQTSETTGTFYNKWPKEPRNIFEEAARLMKSETANKWSTTMTNLLIIFSDSCSWDSGSIPRIQASYHDRFFMVLFTYSTQFSVLKYDLVICTTFEFIILCHISVGCFTTSAVQKTSLNETIRMNTCGNYLCSSKECHLLYRTSYDVNV
jgi:hypothetical protein